jgi:hypothetical protein
MDDVTILSRLVSPVTHAGQPFLEQGDRRSASISIINVLRKITR